MTSDRIQYEQVYEGDPDVFETWFGDFDCLATLVPDQFRWAATAADWARVTRGLPFKSEPGQAEDYRGITLLRSLKVRLLETADEYGDVPGRAGVYLEI